MSKASDGVPPEAKWWPSIFVSGRHGICWICHRRLPVEHMRFIRLEGDGCGENECIDRHACILAAEEAGAITPYAQESACGTSVSARENATGTTTLSSSEVPEIDPAVREVAAELGLPQPRTCWWTRPCPAYPNCDQFPDCDYGNFGL